MALPQILIDSSFLYALLDNRNSKYRVATALLSTTPARYLIPYVVLTETAFLFSRSGGVPAVLRFFDGLLAIQAEFEPILKADLHRARDIMALYWDSKLDFVDCCIMAISERLNITQVCTFDRRDFGMFRPQHCVALDILP